MNVEIKELVKKEGLDRVPEVQGVVVQVLAEVLHPAPGVLQIKNKIIQIIQKKI